MIVVLKIFLASALGIITYQDIKDREVYGILFFILMGLLGYLHYQSVLPIHFFYAIGINFGIVSFCILSVFIYATFKLKRSFFKEAFGIGDLLFFIALATGFPTVTFVILLVFSLIFSLIISLFITNKTNHKTVPLAGYMSLFIGVVFITQWITNALTLYLI
ncbi:hypothetical protein ABW636_20280 [Aquimarina sp. 2201CG1-2-11]|uniref:hypothetical protein n=1 Tax=Aquimarina discodermiae TaxID=3231043 RepID=UPI0034629777